jgi:chromosome segregation ATPase
LETTDITVQILRDIRDEIRGTNHRIDRLEQRFDGVDARLGRIEGRVERVEDRLDHVEGRLAGVESAITKFHLDMLRLSPIGDGDALVKRVSRCERDIAELKERIDPRR